MQRTTPGPRLESRITLAAVLTAVSCSRLFVKLMLQRWGCAASLVETAELLVSELTTNAIRATGVVDPEVDPLALRGVSLVRVQVTAFQGRVFVSVWDSDPCPPVLQDGGLDAEGGRGLLLVSALSARWGYYPSPRGGKVVWAAIAPPPISAAGLPIRRRRPCVLRPAESMRDRNILLRVRDGLLALRSSVPSSVVVGP
jgi:anti-sigma regulatory factor (Ser/Thr protein kinase)